MIQIRPVSDLRNKYPEMEELVLNEDEAVYLTKNGYGSMVVMSLEKYSNLLNELDTERNLEYKFDVEKAMDESEEFLNEPSTEYLTHEEVFSKLRGKINEKKI